MRQKASSAMVEAANVVAYWCWNQEDWTTLARRSSMRKGRLRANGAARREVLPAMLSLVKMAKTPKWVRSLKTTMESRKRQAMAWGATGFCGVRPEVWVAPAPKR